MWLRKLHDETHTMTVFVTHDQEEAMEVAAETLELEAGEIVFVRAKLVRRPGVGVGGERTHVTG